MINIAQFSQIMDDFGGFEIHPHIAVAVSGGSDSMALAILLNQWIQRYSGQVTCLIVDHQLRPESTDEAQKVYQTLTKKGLKVQILTWVGKKPKSRLQEKARQKRYELLENWCIHNHVLHLAVAHHGEDQWETIMYRLSKGTDVGGLIGMQSVVVRPFGRILRPLLAFSKDDLRGIIRDHKIDVVEDPSNQDNRFTRVHWRKLYPQLAALELDQKTIRQARDKWQGTYALYQKALQQAIVSCCAIDSYGCIHVDLTRFLKEDLELQERIMKKVICCFARDGHGVKGSSVRQLLDRLTRMVCGKGITLGGCYILRKKNELLIMRELRATPPPQIIDQTSFIWNYRFIIDVSESYLGLEIAPVSQYLAQKWAKERKIHGKILETLPVIFHGGDVVGLVRFLENQGFPAKVYCFTPRPLVY